MGGMRAFVAAGFIALAAPAAAVCPDSEMRFAPAYNGTFKTYGFPTSFMDPIDAKKSVTGKNGKLCADCESPFRGVQLTSKREFGGGYFQFPFEVGQTFCTSARIDVSRVVGPGAFAHIELDSPAVEVAQSPLTYVFVAVQDIMGVRTVWAEVSGVPVGDPFELSPDDRFVTVELEYAGGQIDVRVQPDGEEGSTTIVDNAAFAFGGSGRLGAGAFDLAKGDRAGIDLQASGEIFTAALRDVIAGIDAQRSLVGGALDDLDGALPADARAKIEEALAALDPALVAAATALPDSKVQAFAVVQLGKALAKLTQARDAIDAATPASLKSAAAAVTKAGLAFHRADRALRNASVSEAKIPPPS
jgi:hypothetical protein